MGKGGVRVKVASGREGVRRGFHCVGCWFRAFSLLTAGEIDGGRGNREVKLFLCVCVYVRVRSCVHVCVPSSIRIFHLFKLLIIQNIDYFL